MALYWTAQVLNISTIQKVLLDSTSLEGEEELDKKAGNGLSPWGQLTRGGISGQVASDWQVDGWSSGLATFILKTPSMY